MEEMDGEGEGVDLREAADGRSVLSLLRSLLARSVSSSWTNFSILQKECGSITKTWSQAACVDRQDVR